jgi:hypothetical protein
LQVPETHFSPSPQSLFSLQLSLDPQAFTVAARITAAIAIQPNDLAISR